MRPSFFCALCSFAGEWPPLGACGALRVTPCNIIGVNLNTEQRAPAVGGALGEPGENPGQGPLL